jgi:hypothetical protein
MTQAKKAHVVYASLILEVLQHVLFVPAQSAISISSDIIYYSSGIANGQVFILGRPTSF